jgi:hypothetical protein
VVPGLLDQVRGEWTRQLQGLGSRDLIREWVQARVGWPATARRLPLSPPPAAIWKGRRFLSGQRVAGASWKAGWLVGGVGGAVGFIGPLVIWPEANLGPLLGILFTGPAGFVLVCLDLSWSVLRGLPDPSQTANSYGC